MINNYKMNDKDLGDWRYDEEAEAFVVKINNSRVGVCEFIADDLEAMAAAADVYLDNKEDTDGVDIYEMDKGNITSISLCANDIIDVFWEREASEFTWSLEDFIKVVNDFGYTTAMKANQ